MKTGIAIGLAGVVAATMCSTGLAQDVKTPQAQTSQAQTPQAQTSVATGLKRGEFQINATPSSKGVLIDMDCNKADVAVVLRAVAQKANLKIWVSDDVTGKINGKWLQRPAKSLIDVLVVMYNLDSGKVGDTYLLVQGKPGRLVLPREATQLAPAPRFAPEPNNSQPRHDWPSFPFNGDSIHVVPLAPDNKTESAGEKKSDAKIKAPPFPVGKAKMKPGELQIDATPSATGLLLAIKAGEMNPATLLRALADKAGLRILISDDIGGNAGLLVSADINQIAPQEALKLVADNCDLKLGKSGETYLVVRATPRPPFVLQRQHVVPAPRSNPFDPGQDKQPPPRNWRAFPFNGDDIYVVPLGPDIDRNTFVTEQSEAKADTSTQEDVTTPTQ